MRTRAKLHEILCNAIDSDHVYYNPPENIKLVYPCIVYNSPKINQKFANNKAYSRYRTYQATYISKKADYDEVIDKIMDSIPYISHNRHFTSDGLHHDVFSINF